jgi:argininosuccinate lyase
MREALDKGFLYATAIADYLVLKNIPFRKAHEITGNLVGYCIKNKKTFLDLKLAEFKAIDSIFTDDVLNIFDPEKIINAQKIQGGTSRDSVKRQIKDFKK